MIIQQKNCFYCKANVTEGYRLRVSVTAERAWHNGTNLQSKGIFHQVIICPECARSYFGIRIIEHSNTQVELKLLTQQMLPAKRIRKWNPTRR